MRASIIKRKPVAAGIGLSKEKSEVIKTLAQKYGVQFKEFGSDCGAASVGSLCEGETIEVTHQVQMVSSEILLFSAFDRNTLSAFIDSMNAQGARVELKAVCTDYNRSWSLCELEQELITENEAINRSEAERKAQNK